MQRYADILKQVSDAKQLQGVGSQNAAKQLLDDGGHAVRRLDEGLGGVPEGQRMAPSGRLQPGTGGKR